MQVVTFARVVSKSRNLKDLELLELTQTLTQDLKRQKSKVVVQIAMLLTLLAQSYAFAATPSGGMNTCLSKPSNHCTA